MTGRERLNVLLAGFAAGGAGGLFGVGGGLVLIPILTSALGLTQHRAHGTSLAVIGFAALVSVVVYGSHGNVAWFTAALIAAGSLLTARLGARLAARTSARGLTRAFAVFLVVVAIRLLVSTPEASGRGIGMGPVALATDLSLGLVVGLFSGYFGVGGGLLIVPALSLFQGMPQQLAQGTSLAAILVIAPAGALEHARHGNVVGRLVPALAVGAAIGGPVASWLVQALPHTALARAFAVFLLGNAVWTWVRAGRARATSAPSAAGDDAARKAH